MGHAKCPIDGGERRSRLPTFHLLLSSPPTSSGLYQPAQSVCHPRNYHVVITTNIRAKGMAELLEGSVGKYAERGRKRQLEGGVKRFEPWDLLLWPRHSIRII
jgi:hypothetical protein